MTPITIFVPSGTPTSIAPSQHAAITFTMPAVDASNVDLAVQNAGITPAWLSFAPGAPVGPNVPGCLFVPGLTVLCTANPETLAAAAADPLVFNPQGGAYASATQVSAIVQQQGGTITLTRGTATARGTW